MKSNEKKSVSALSGEEKKASFALGKTNLKLIGISFAVIVVGFLLMLGPGTTPEAYNPDIFSFRRIVLAPGIAFVGFVFMVYAIMRKSK
ncbi:MAG TPA: DUF3098 domain-containing protein [Candidatus Barnesiella excrementavium]|nr:DUF3098 domain-containing protein [Candidatus Barnesiella excrementavium]